MSDQVIPESLITRIRALIAKAAAVADEFPGEAQLFTEKAQELMGRYNLEMSSLDEASATADSVREKLQTEIAASHEWQITLMSELAKNNFCHHWTTARRARREDGTGRMRVRTKHNLIGRRANVVVVIEMYRYLLTAMNRLSAQAGYTDGRDRSTRSWYAGCVDRLATRLAAQRQVSEAESRTRRGDPSRGSGADLVLSDVYSSEEDLNSDMLHGYDPGTTVARRKAQEARMEVLRAQWAAEEAAERAAPPKPCEEKPETEAQRAKREAADKRWYDAYRRRQEKEASKTDPRAYDDGSRAGRDIGLDKQVDAKAPSAAIR